MRDFQPNVFPSTVPLVDFTICWWWFWRINKNVKHHYPSCGFSTFNSALHNINWDICWGYLQNSKFWNNCQWIFKKLGGIEKTGAKLFWEPNIVNWISSFLFFLANIGQIFKNWMTFLKTSIFTRNCDLSNNTFLFNVILGQWSPYFHLYYTLFWL